MIGRAPSFEVWRGGEGRATGAAQCILARPTSECVYVLTVFYHLPLGELMVKGISPVGGCLTGGNVRKLGLSVWTREREEGVHGAVSCARARVS